MIIRKIKKFFYNRKLDRKINYIEKFVTGKCSYKDIDPELDDMEKDIERRLKEKLINNKISQYKYATVMNGLYYHRNVNNSFEKFLIENIRNDNMKYEESNVKETQNTNCEAIGRSKDVR